MKITEFFTFLARVDELPILPGLAVMLGQVKNIADMLTHHRQRLEMNLSLN